MFAELRNIHSYENMSRQLLEGNTLNATISTFKPTSKAKAKRRPKPKSAPKATKNPPPKQKQK